MDLISLVNKKLAIETLLAHAFIATAAVYFFFFRKKYPGIFAFFAKHGILFAFIISLAATVGSLFYSEIAGYEPCKLCWFQRIFMYPQVVLLAIALIKKDRQITMYGIALSVVGAAIAAYHYIMQIGIFPSLPCPAVGYSVSCSQRFVLQFGYITIPMIALTAFALIIIFLLAAKLKK